MFLWRHGGWRISGYVVAVVSASLVVWGVTWLYYFPCLSKPRGRHTLSMMEVEEKRDMGENSEEVKQRWDKVKIRSWHHLGIRSKWMYAYYVYLLFLLFLGFLCWKVSCKILKMGHFLWPYLVYTPTFLCGYIINWIN